MYQGELKIEDGDAMEEFFENFHLVSEDEKEKAWEVVEEADVVHWPAEIVFEVPDEKWEEYAREHPDEAKVVEQWLEHVDEDAPGEGEEVV